MAQENTSVASPFAVFKNRNFFGEIAALTGTPRTANILVKEECHLLRVPANTLREMTKNPQVNRAFYSKMMERMLASQMIDSPRKSGINQESARDVRSTDTSEMLAVMI